jgi:hypothetical protein
MKTYGFVAFAVMMCVILSACGAGTTITSSFDVDADHVEILGEWVEGEWTEGEWVEEETPPPETCDPKLLAFYCKSDSDCVGAPQPCYSVYGSCGWVQDGPICKKDCSYEPLCENDEVCANNVCCKPQCDGKECGDDGCGGSCGSCGDGYCSNGACVCTPSCKDKECGDDGCGGTCGVCYVPGEGCVDWECQCIPKCDGKECGYDGCGDECGLCPNGKSCLDGVCIPDVEQVCNDGIDEDLDFDVDCEDEDCWGEDLGKLLFTIQQSSSYLIIKCWEGWSKYYCSLYSSSSVFSYEEYYEDSLNCSYRAVDYWIHTDGSIIVDNSADPYIAEVYEDPDCSGSHEECSGSIDYAGDHTVPALGELTFPSPGEDRILMVRWKYYQLEPPDDG